MEMIVGCTKNCETVVTGIIIQLGTVKFGRIYTIGKL